MKGKWQTTKDTNLHENQRVLDFHALIHGVNGKSVTILSCFVPCRVFCGSHFRIKVHRCGGGIGVGIEEILVIGKHSGEIRRFANWFDLNPKTEVRMTFEAIMTTEAQRHRGTEITGFFDEPKTGLKRSETNILCVLRFLCASVVHQVPMEGNFSFRV